MCIRMCCSDAVSYTHLDVYKRQIHYGVYCLVLLVANANISFTAGYAVGFICNYFLTTFFTFRSKPSSRNAVGFGFSHLINYLLEIGLLNLFLWIGAGELLAPILVMIIVDVYKRQVNTRRPNASAVEELRRYASFIGTSNHKDLLTDTSGSRRFIGVEVTGVIDVVRPIDYEQLYAQAMALLRSNERYWFDEKEEAIMTEANREFEQSPAIEQLFQVYYRVAEEEEEGEWLLAADILQRIQKASKMKISSGQVNYFGRILQKLGVKSFRKTRGVYYHVVRCV